VLQLLQGLLAFHWLSHWDHGTSGRKEKKSILRAN